MRSWGRRRFVLGGVACAAGTLSRAQAPKKRVGIVFNVFRVVDVQGERPEPVMREFLEGLRQHGYVEGRNVAIERRSAEGKLDRLEPILRDLAQQPLDVIVVAGQEATRVAKRVVTTVPIVTSGMFSPVEEGLVASLARPGGNLTGTVPAFGQEMGVKRVELLHDLVPRARNVAYLGTRLSERDDIPQDVSAAASTYGVSLHYVRADLRDLEASLREVERGKPDALLVVPTVPLYPFYRTFVAFAGRARLPDVHGFQEAVEAGGLASYGGDTYDTWRRTARYVARILDGAKPGELPVEKSDRYRLRINRARAEALGLAIPPALAQRAEIL